MSDANSNASLDALGVAEGQFLQKPFTPHDLLRRLVDHGYRVPG